MCKKDIAQNQLKETRDFKHKHKERLCYCCDTLQESEDKLHKLSICNEDRMYSSDFSGMNIEIQLCDKCYKEQYEKWFNEKPKVTDHNEEIYKYEGNITQLIENFPLENQEYVWNHTYSAYEMDRQDWIDMKLGILSEEKYKEYKLISPLEIKSYQERFSTCQHPMNIIYEDGTKSCWCPFKAFGGYNQKLTHHDACTQCHYCDFYKKRITPIKKINSKEFDLNIEKMRYKIAEEKFNESK